MESPKIYKQRFDFYWKSIAIYTVVLIVYGLTRNFIGERKLIALEHDPVFILLGLFIIGSTLMYLHKLFWVRTLIIDETSITMKNRFHQTKFTKENIENLYIGKERPFQSRETYRVIKITLKNKMRKIRIRPHNYWDDKQLFDDISRVKEYIGK